MATINNPQPAPVPAVTPAPAEPPTQPEKQLIIYSRSSFFYWWPIWVAGYVLALITWIGGEKVTIAPPGTPLGHMKAVLIHPSPTLGVIFVTIFFLVLMITNVAVRGVWSLVVVLAIGFITVLMAFFGLWDPILAVLPDLAVYANLGFYVLISTVLLIIWLFTFFVSDRLNYWRITPGQITYQHVVGGGEKSYDTRMMVFEQLQEDVFRHWVLGLGSGDIRISTAGARREEIYIPNVLFVNRKVKQIQQLIAMRPDQNQGQA
jgi:hypothetical protein